MCKNVGKLQLTFNFILYRKMCAVRDNRFFIRTSIPHSNTKRETCNDRSCSFHEDAKRREMTQFQ